MTEPAKAATVYRQVSPGPPPIYFHSSIVTWDGWPDDVREIVRRWNADGRLRFVYLGMPFACPYCRRRVDSAGSTACRLHGLFVCDDCMIERARRYGTRGRPETELERLRRNVAGHQRRIARYRHNAIQERIYVALLLTRLDCIAERAYDALADERRDDPVPGLHDALAAIEELRAATRPYIEKTRRIVDDHRPSV